MSQSHYLGHTKVVHAPQFIAILIQGWFPLIPIKVVIGNESDGDLETFALNSHSECAFDSRKNTLSGCLNVMENIDFIDGVFFTGDFDLDDNDYYFQKDAIDEAWLLGVGTTYVYFRFLDKSFKVLKIRSKPQELLQNEIELRVKKRLRRELI